MKGLSWIGVLGVVVGIAQSAEAQDASASFSFSAIDFGVVDIFEQSGDLLIKYTAPSTAVSGDNPRATRFAFQLDDTVTGTLSSVDPAAGDFADDIDDLFFGVDNSTSGFPTPQVGGPITIDFAATGTDSGNPGIPLDGTGAMDRFFISSDTDNLLASDIEKIGVRFQGLDNSINEGSLFLVDEPVNQSPSA